jgi:hypothetical protein
VGGDGPRAARLRPRRFPAVRGDRAGDGPARGQRPRRQRGADRDASGAFALSASALSDARGLAGVLRLAVLDVTGIAAVPVYDGSLAGFTGVALGTFAAGAAHRYRFELAYPAGRTAAADNPYQGASASVAFDWDAVATADGGATTPTAPTPTPTTPTTPTPTTPADPTPAEPAPATPAPATPAPAPAATGGGSGSIGGGGATGTGAATPPGGSAASGGPPR